MLQNLDPEGCRLHSFWFPEPHYKPVLGYFCDIKGIVMRKFNVHKSSGACSARTFFRHRWTAEETVATI